MLEVPSKGLRKRGVIVGWYILYKSHLEIRRIILTYSSLVNANIAWQNDEGNEGT